MLSAVRLAGTSTPVVTVLLALEYTRISAALPLGKVGAISALPTGSWATPPRWMSMMLVPTWTRLILLALMSEPENSSRRAAKKVLALGSIVTPGPRLMTEKPKNGSVAL